MAKFERLEPRADEMHVFDGSIEEEEAEEGSRLPALILIALLVLAAFAGVVYLAYTQGVERGRADAPRVIVAQASGNKLKVYQQPAPAEDESNEADSVPPPPTPVTKAPEQQTASQDQPSPNTQAPSAAPATETAASPAPEAATRPAPLAQTPAPSPVVHATPKAVAANPPPSEPRVATHAPAPLVAPSQTEPATTAPEPAATTASAPVGKTEAPPAKPAASGSALLQIGAYKSQDEADAAWRAFQKSHPVVGGYQSDIKQVDLGEKGTWYRLRIGPFADKDAASTMCTKLKADGATCLVAR
jgi:cell division protein FtsN